VSDVQVALTGRTGDALERLVKGPPLSEEIIKLSGSRALVLVPEGWGSEGGAGAATPPAEATPPPHDAPAGMVVDA
jgi:hypothetical protein